MRRGRARPVQVTYVSEREAGETPSEPGFQGVYGRGDWGAADVGRRARNRRELAARDLLAVAPVPLSADAFAAFWERFRSVGLLDLPEHPGGTPPVDQPYFLMDDSRRTRIFARPDDSQPSRLGPQEIEQIRVWRRAERIIASGPAAGLFH